MTAKRLGSEVIRPPDIPELSARLKWARKRKDWTQPELARASGVSLDVIKKAEAGQTRQPRQIRNIAAALEVSPGWLAHNSADLDRLEGWAISRALQIQDLSEDDRQSLLRHLDALIRNK